MNGGQSPPIQTFQLSWYRVDSLPDSLEMNIPPAGSAGTARIVQAGAGFVLRGTSSKIQHIGIICTTRTASLARRENPLKPRKLTALLKVPSALNCTVGAAASGSMSGAWTVGRHPITGMHTNAR
ncbi:hypothetical protein BST61_g5148 [Cercospora zeina]